MFPQMRHIQRFVVDMHEAHRVWDEVDGAEKGTERLRFEEGAGWEVMSV
jgi:hypothetical protein